MDADAEGQERGLSGFTFPVDITRTVMMVLTSLLWPIMRLTTASGNLQSYRHHVQLRINDLDSWCTNPG